MTPSLLLMIPLMSAVATLFLRAQNSWQRGLSLWCSLIFLGAAALNFREVIDGAILVEQMGAWPAPFGISLVIDRLSGVMVFITAFVGLVVNIYLQSPRQVLMQSQDFHPLFHLLLAGVTGAFITGDFFNLFVFFEILLLSSFVLMIQELRDVQFNATVKYVLLNLVASMIFLLGLGLLYNGLGTLNMADVGRLLRQTTWSLSTAGGFCALFLAFAIKAGMFPVYFWLPASYPQTNIATTSLFAALLTKVGVYALIRLNTMAGPALPELYLQVIVVISLLTMFVGVLGAATQSEIRRILSFHIISQIGYITLGLGYMTELALAGTVFYLIHHIVVKANLFLVAGVIDRLWGSTTLAKIGETLKVSKWLGLLFLIPALSLAGVPPLSGFWAKLFVLQSTIEAEDFLALGTSLFVGLFTLYSMVKIWLEAFWKEHPNTAPTAQIHEPLTGREKLTMGWAIGLFCVWTVAMGLGVGYAADFALQTGRDLKNSDRYIERVLGSRGEK
jgi:multicomponent Na+:H+ antiporter subunit D